MPPKKKSACGWSGCKSTISRQGFAFPGLKSTIPGQGYGYFGGLKSAIFWTKISGSFRGPVKITLGRAQMMGAHRFSVSLRKFFQECIKSTTCKVSRLEGQPMLW